ncbi:MAG: DNA-binding protein WhiA [Actinobacteria bacterium]|nr:DNA-binding protein WhiA [Actinomycetota bacterium]
MNNADERVRNELAHYQASKQCCRIAELSALMHLDGVYKISGTSGHSFITESPGANTAKKVYTLVRTLFDLDMDLCRVERSSPRRESVYTVEIRDQNGFYQMLNEAGILDSNLNPMKAIPSRLVKSGCCVSAALRGAFLGGGYLSEPYGQSNLEITFTSGELAVQFRELLLRKGLKAGLRSRRGAWVLYLKKRQDITETLALIGAHGICLQWESQSVINSTKNRVNRVVNCDSANAGRLAKASLRQRELINRLKSKGVLSILEPELAELAEVRLRNPQASYGEIGKLLSPPVGKSVVQGRMKKIESMDC